jgi:hypothetical protein
MKKMQMLTSTRGALVVAIATLAPLTLVHADTFGSGDTAPVKWGSTAVHAAAAPAGEAMQSANSFDYLHPQPAPRGVAGPMRQDPPAYRGGDSWNLQERDMQRHLGDIGAGT